MYNAGTPIGNGFYVAILDNQIELKTGTHKVCDKGIVWSEFFIPSGCPMVDSRMIVEHIDELNQFLNGEDRLFLIDLTSSENVLSFDALKKWSQSEVLNKSRLAEAYVVDTLADLIFLKQHIRLNHLSYPAKVFQSTKRAKEWLIQFKESPNAK